MNYTKSFFRFILIFTVALAGCKETEKAPEIGLQYYPADKAHTNIYQIDSITFRGDLENGNQIVFFSKEVIVESSNHQGEIKLIQEVFYATQYPTDDWQFDFKFATTINEREVIENKRNIIKKKLSLPIKDKGRWDENVFNMEAPYFMTYQNIGESFDVLTKKYAQTVTASLIEVNDIVEILSSTSVYAVNIGLIYKKRVNIQKQQKSGYIYEKKLVYSSAN
jgi:hypothetical protein